MNSKVLCVPVLRNLLRENLGPAPKGPDSSGLFASLRRRLSLQLSNILRSITVLKFPATSATSLRHKPQKMPPVRSARNRKPPPDGFDDIEDTLLEFANKMKDAENASHEGKKRHEVVWPIFQISHQRMPHTSIQGIVTYNLSKYRLKIYLRPLLC